MGGDRAKRTSSKPRDAPAARLTPAAPPLSAPKRLESEEATLPMRLLRAIMLSNSSDASDRTAQP